MKSLFSERQTSIEGFYTNVAFPGSQAATRSNTTSDAVYKARKMLEQDNKLDEKVAKLNEVGKAIQDGVAKYKDRSSRLLSQIKSDAAQQDKLRLSNIIINRLYTTPELNTNVRVVALGESDKTMDQNEIEKGNPGEPTVHWAFKKMYRKIPDDEQYKVQGGLTTNYYGQLSKLKYMVKNQGKKLTFNECKELAAQQGHFIIGLTNTEVKDGVYRSTCLMPSLDDFMNMEKNSYGDTKKNPRIVSINDLGSQKLSFIVRDGEVGQTPVYSFNSAIAKQGNYTPGNDKYGYPAFSFEGIYNLNNDITVEYDKNKTTKSTQLINLGYGTIFQAALEAKRLGASFFAMSNMGRTTAAEGEIGADSVSTDRRRRSGTIYIVKELSDVKKSGSAAQDTVFKYGPEEDSMVSNPPLYEQQYILAIQGNDKSSVAVYRIASSEDNMALVHKGAINVESIPFDSKLPEDSTLGGIQQSLGTGAGMGILNRRTISLSEWKKIQTDPTSQRALDGWVTKAVENASKYNFPYMGFFFRYIDNSTGELIAFGTPSNSPTTDNTFAIKDNNGITYGTANTITYYMLVEKGTENNFGFPRFSQFLNGVGYVDRKKFLRPYPPEMLDPEDVNETDYEMLNNTTSEYFNMDNLPLSELQNVRMTIPACRNLCNKYYKECKAFVFDAGARTVGMTGVRDGTIVPKCSLKTIDPTIYSWGTEKQEYSRMYKKIPQIDNNWTCTKKVQSLPASYLLAGQSQFLGTGKYIGIDEEDNIITPLKKGEFMDKDEKCGTWRAYDQDAQAMRRMQANIGENIEAYVELLGELKTYNKDLLQRAEINQPMVDDSVRQYNEIIEQISQYAQSGEFRIDKYKTQMADLSRKSDTYIYILWLAIAVIVVFFAIRAIMKIKSQ